MVSGIHHVTGITANVQANVDFYAGFLGLRLVKQTGGYADAEQLHLFYGDHLGNPGSLITFLVWEGTGRGRTGIGQVSEIGLAVPAGSIGEWLTRALSLSIAVEGPVREFGESVLRLKDPDGQIVKLVGVDVPASELTVSAPTRLRGVTVLTDKAEATADFIAKFGYRKSAQDGLTQRMVSDTDVVDVREVSGFVPSIPGAGVLDHVAFRARDHEELVSMKSVLEFHQPTAIFDRKYFFSLYVRDPANILIEYATDAPGMSVDEAPEDLGKTLFMPPRLANSEQDLKVMLPQFSLPGEERIPLRDLPFIHRFYRPKNADGSVLVLLHGSGGNEAELMPFAHRVAPHATLLGVRGRAMEEGSPRWFRRFTTFEFDQADIKDEAEAFDEFIKEAVKGYGLDTDRLIFLGYSNGANLLSAMMQLYPDAVQKAVLLRGQQVLINPPKVNLSDARILMLNGSEDPFNRNVSALIEALMAGGAQLTSVDIEAGHGLVDLDRDEVADWLVAQSS